MKTSLSMDEIIETLREARKRTETHCMPQHSPEDNQGARFELSLIIGLFADELGFPKGLDSESSKFLRRIWGKPSAQVQKESLEYVAETYRRAREACTCDGGRTTGCPACSAEKEVARLKAAGFNNPLPRRQPEYKKGPAPVRNQTLEV